ncbi:dehydrogenase [Nocardioides sp. Y6]|uniref:Dehydrogenase n=1 Tax=Nocardioides malaquae TaxID=2773426 RepID=A0ABR9RV99_9ACTN|nr:dehydrogenase [Nocardioides malaquae]MBE7325482.1 dehydrogenase [Nocardioides malaquae]
MTRPVIVNVSLAGPELDHDQDATLLGESFRLVRRGTSGDVDAAVALVEEWRDRAAVFALSGVREARAAGLFGGRDSDVARIRAACGDVPVTDGELLTDVLQEWAIRSVQSAEPGYFTNARVLVLGHGTHSRTAGVLAEFTPNVEHADPGARLDRVALQAAASVLGLAGDVASLPMRLLPGGLRRTLATPAEWVANEVARRRARDNDVVVGAYDELTGFDLEDLAATTVVSAAISPGRLTDLAARGVDRVIDTTPQPFDGVTVVAATLEAVVRLHRGGDVSVDDMLRAIEEADLEPRRLDPHGPRRHHRFAFVIHPLSTQYFRNVQPLGLITQVPGMTPVVEKAAAYLPPFVYSHVTGITSPTGAEAEGWLITVGGTPKELMAHPPEFTYSRLLQAADLARKLGAQVMGLGAFTKVVGDAGVTVAKQAPLPVTTGNSYSASGALWAAHEAIRRLGIAEVDEKGRLHGSTMVIGATGSIGAACARLLALASDELWLVSPESAKLLSLKAEIEAEKPRAVVHVATRPDEVLGEMDMIVTATSAAGQKVLDVMALKPGCVVTDVARPLDLSAEDVAKRPDVLVVESGEIKLPGDVRMKDIGLPPGVVYACLAETVVLALEGRYEAFTVGRTIEWSKVKEIYRLGLKHGMELATISGVNGVYTDDDFARVRTRALAARAEGGRS